MAKMVDRIRKALGLPVRIAGAAYTDEWWGDIPPADPHAVMDGIQLPYAGLDAARTPTHGVPALFADLEEIVEDEDEADWEAKLREAKARAASPAIPKAVVAANPPAPVVAAVAAPKAEPSLLKQKLDLVPRRIDNTPKKVELVPKKVELAPKKVELVPKKVELAPRKPEASIGPKPLYTPRKPLYQPKKRDDETLRGMPTARIPETPDWMEEDWSKVIQKAKEKSAKAAVQAPQEEDWDALIRRAKSAAV